MQQALTFPAPRRHALVAGLAISALLHALLLFYVRMPDVRPADTDRRRWTQPLTVRLLPPPVVPSEPATEPKATATERTARPRRAPPQAIAIVPQRGVPAATVPAPTPEPTPPAEPRVDIAAARAAARGMANDLKAPSGNWAAEKLNKDKEFGETRDERLGKAVANSARPDCRSGEGGLLAPLLWMMDKKDSGCKF